MTSDFWSQIGVMALTFGLALVPALASRRMERSDYLTNGLTNGEFEFGPSFNHMVDQKPNNIFMAKVTYYLNL